MNKRLTALLISGALSLSMGIPAMAEGAKEILKTTTTSSESSLLPDSVLYYGQVKEITKAEDGTISKISLDSDRLGQYIINLSEKTVWIDSGNHTADDPSDLKEGEFIYVFHSSVVASSMPPQSAAFAIVRNIPMDIGCAQYYKVEAVTKETGLLKITTDNEGLYILVDNETKLLSYNEKGAVSVEDIQPENYIMVWDKGYSATSYPSQKQASHIMLLPDYNDTLLTRGKMISMLHDYAGNPIVNYAMDYSDVNDGDSYAEAIRWATSERLASGYGNNDFGPNDTATLEQFITVLWRYTGSPMLMDYSGLTQFSDASEISSFARQAMMWAHQKGLFTDKLGPLEPQSFVSETQANALLQTLSTLK